MYIIEYTSQYTFLLDIPISNNYKTIVFFLNLGCNLTTVIVTKKNNVTRNQKLLIIMQMFIFGYGIKFLGMYLRITNK